jgi:hypothetical protein
LKKIVRANTVSAEVPIWKNQGLRLPYRFLIYLITYIFVKLPNPGFRTKSLIKEKGKQFSLKLQYSTFSKEAHV